MPFQYIHNGLSIKEKADLENAVHEVEQQRADIDYLAMMAEVELFTGEENNDESEIQ